MTYSESEYKRIRNEKYYTPQWCFDLLLDKVDFSGKSIWEPAAGNCMELYNSLLERRTIHNRGWYFSDLFPDRIEISVFDFLQANTSTFNSNLDCNIITNPPYGSRGKIAEKFIEVALQRTKATKGKVAMLLRADFDSAITRQHLFGKCEAFDRKIVLLKRPKWTNIEDKATPRKNFAWFIWDWSRDYNDKPVIEYGK